MPNSNLFLRINGAPFPLNGSRREKPSGFSLIELMLVVAITGILVGVAMPNFVGILEDAKMSKALDDMHTIKQACIMYYTNESKFPTEIRELLGKYMAKVPSSPWGTDYKIDDFYVTVKSAVGELSVPYFNPGTIAFLRDGDLFTRDFISGSSTIKLTDLGGLDSFAWDKGGSRIFFSRQDNLFSMTRGAREGDFEEEFEGGSDPVISPDGIYMCYRNGNDLYIKTTNVKSPGQLFIPNADDITWSPNSSYICYASGNFLWLSKVSNGRLTGKPIRGFTGNSPRWSTLNQQIVFLRGTSLYATSAKDISEGSDEQPVKIAENVSYPTWIPRTQKIMYIDKSKGDLVLMVDVRYPDREPGLIFVGADAVACSPN